MLKIFMTLTMCLFVIQQFSYAQDYSRFDPKLYFGNKCIDIDGMYMNFSETEFEAYASPINGGRIIEGNVRGLDKFCFVRFKSVIFEGRDVDITYAIERKTFKYEKEVVSRTRFTTDELAKKEALKKGIPFQSSVPDREKFNGKWKFIPCTGRK